MRTVEWVSPLCASWLTLADSCRFAFLAMGLNGSDVAKSVSQIVLADDNFASITRAIKKGRGTLMNLSKFLIYLLSGNVAE